ncbi:hypothetical protein QOZ80_7BG0584600 [Eleusine coracana subsp. coracana]|nr:hypothetical protein QOZ80_7BG0584600 [Eleusine coracana subsp. coracana]
MKLITILAITTALIVHHLSLRGVASIANHTTFHNVDTTGFSFPLIAKTTVHHRNDDFLHLFHPLHENLLQRPPSSTSSSVENITFLHSKTNILEPLQFSFEMVVDVGTGSGRQVYYLKIDNSEKFTWIQCIPCTPHAQQHNSLFNPAASPTFHYIPNTSPLCQPPHSHPEGNQCAFHLISLRGMSVTGYLSQDQVTILTSVLQNFLFGCSHSTHNFDSEGKYAGVISLGRNPTSLVMQAAAHGRTQFSYCLFEGGKTNRQGFLRFGTDIPHSLHYRTTSILPAFDAHESGYYLNLIGVSLGGRKLDRIHPEMFARGKDNKGGCVIDLSTPLTVMVQEAYKIIEDAIWSDLQHHKVERAKHPGFGLCFRATEATKGQLQSLSLQFSEEEAVLILSPPRLFLMMHDIQGQIACLAMTPGDRTIIGAFQQVDTRFVYDVKDSKLSFASESCIQDTTEVN